MKLDHIQYDPQTGHISTTFGELHRWRKNGYDYVFVGKRKYPVHLLIHDLLGIDRTGLIVVHLNGNKLDNSADNLALMTRKESLEYFFDERQRTK